MSVWLNRSCIRYKSAVWSWHCSLMVMGQTDSRLLGVRQQTPVISKPAMIWENGWLMPSVSCLTQGYQSVLLCGSDIVGIDAGYLQQAAEKLEQSGMVISPAYDGGYCLIGFTAESFAPQVFARIDWSTEQVLQQTLERCEQAGIRPALLGMLRDIDTLDDLKTVCPSPKHHTRLDTQMT